MKILSTDEIEKMISANSLSPYFRTESMPEIDITFLSLYEYLCRKRPANFISLDLETTGLSSENDEIVEIGAVRVIDGNIADRFHYLLKPLCHVSSSASKVNHITDDMLDNQPYIFQILPELLGFIGPYPVAAHNAKFDARFLAQACLRYRFKCPRLFFDTMQLVEFFPDLPNKKLSTLLDAASIENTLSHRALSDAEALARLLVTCVNKKYCLKVPAEYRPEYSKNEHFSGSVDKIDNSLSGKRFVITGNIEGYQRIDFEKLILSHGGKTTLSISNATDYLIVGNFPGLPDNYVTAKVVYAKNLQSEGRKIQIIRPEDVFKMLEEL